MRKIIINADDFGMSEAFNHGIIKGYKDGVVSSTSLMPNLPSAEHAIELAKDYPDLFIGQHTNFVLGKPCADVNLIPSMVDENGNFYKSGVYRRGERKFVYEEVKIETIAQMERFKELTGEYPQHLEGHAVMDEVIGKVFYDIAIEYGIHTSSLFTGKKLDGYLMAGLKFDPEMMSILNQGVSVENFINDDFNLLELSKDMVIELHFHPGYVDQFILDNSTLTTPRCKDLQTLCDPRVSKWLKDNEFELTDFGKLKI